jgi:two-component system chemotaxis response regulator CheY
MPANGIYLGNLRFLVVEDSEFTRRLIRTVLRALDVRAENIHEAADGTEALKLLTSQRPDIAIVDYMMKPLDGIRFTTRVRRNFGYPQRTMPIIMLSAYAETSIVAMARDVGVTEVVAKPISVMSLYLRIEEAILRPRQFVETSSFFGPDRRRRRDIGYDGPRRRKEDLAAQPTSFEAAPQGDPP